MSRLLESSLTGKISKMLIESERKSFKEKLTESAKKCLTEKAWTELKSGSELRKAIRNCDENEIDDLKHVLDVLKTCCNDAKALCKDEYDANGFQSVIDDIEMIYDDEELDQSSVDWELEGFFDWCDSADIFVSLDECDGPKPIEKTREELIRDHGTDDVDLINAGKEPEERVALKETEGFVNELDAIADFMIDFDKYGFEESYDGDADAKRDQLIQDITRDRKTVACYLNDVVVEGLGTEEQQAEAKRLLGAADLEKYIKESETPDLDADDKAIESDKKKAIEDRIAELRLAIEDGVSEDEKADMEKEIAELENQLNESSLNEDITVITPENEAEARRYLDSLYQSKSDYESDSKYHHGYTKSEYQFQKSEIKRMEKLLKAYEKGLKSESTLSEGEDSQGALKAFSDGLTEAIRLQELRNAEEMGEFFQEAMGILRSVAEENGYMVEGEKLEESVSVATTDGSTVDTQDAASVQSNDGTVTVVTGDTTVVINNTPAEPALDIPVEEPIEEVPTEEIIDEPVEEIPAEEVPVEEPVEDEVIEESDDEYGIDANVDAKSLAVLKNQGITYMLQIEETSGKTTYWVCDNFNAETNEGDNAEVFTEKEKADEEYFKRVGLEPTVEEE